MAWPMPTSRSCRGPFTTPLLPWQIERHLLLVGRVWVILETICLAGAGSLTRYSASDAECVTATNHGSQG